MSLLLFKRLMRSLWRSKLRLFAVVLMVFVSAFAGVTFGGYAASIEPIYDVIYADDENGTNLADIWVDTKTGWWTQAQTKRFCQEVTNDWPNGTPSIDQCEARFITPATLFLARDEKRERIGGVFHGIPAEAQVDRIWFPTGHSEGRAPSKDDELVLDAHVADVLGVKLAQEVVLSAGNGEKTFRVVGIGFHPNHIYFVPEGAIFPPENGTFVVGYLSDTGLSRLMGEGAAPQNQILLDLDGTPAFDLPDTPMDEGVSIRPLKKHIAATLQRLGMSGRIRDRGEYDAVEFMRQDLEGAKKTSVPFTVMIALIASITLLLSMQRLVQSQAREIAILRTLGVPRRQLMQAYLLAPIFVGAVGCLGGGLCGPFGMNAMLDLYQALIGVPVLSRHVPVSTYVIVTIAVMTVVFLSGVWPAWKCSQLDPLAILGGQNEIRVGSAWLQKSTRWLPAVVGLSLRSSLRRPVRVLMTFLAIGVSLMLFGSIQMMSRGMQEIVVGGLAQDQSWDTQLFVRPGGDEKLMTWADSKNLQAERIIELPIGKIEQESGPARNVTLVGLEHYESTNAMRKVRLGAGAYPQPAKEPLQVLADQGIIVMSGWRIGDVRQVALGEKQVSIQVVGMTQGDLARTLFFHRRDLEQVTGVSASAVLLRMPKNDLMELEVNALSAGLIDRASLLEGMKKLLEQQSQMLRSMMGFGLLLAAIVMFNTLLMNMSERDRELATLRVLGASTWRLGVMLLLEALGIGLVGGIVGVIFAFGGALGLAAAFSTWQFYFPVLLDPNVAIELVVAVIGLALLTTPVGVWRLRRMDLVEKVKEFGGV